MRRSLISRFFIAGMVILGLAGAGVNSPSRAENAAYPSVEEIPLKHTDPEYVMLLLGLYSQEDLRNGRKSAWSATDLNSGTKNLLPEGIDFILPYDRGSSMIIQGKVEAIEDLKALIGKLDVTPKLITLEIILTSKVDAGKLAQWRSEKPDSNGFSSGYMNADVLKALERDLSEKAVHPIRISTLNNIRAMLNFGPARPTLSMDGTDTQTSQIEDATEISLLPRIDGTDNSISMKIDLLIAGQSYQTIEQIAQGETFAIYYVTKDPEKRLLMTIAPSVIDESKD